MSKKQIITSLKVSSTVQHFIYGQKMQQSQKNDSDDNLNNLLQPHHPQNDVIDSVVADDLQSYYNIIDKKIIVNNEINNNNEHGNEVSKPLIEELIEYNSDNGTYALYRSLKAPKSFLLRCIDIVEMRLMQSDGLGFKQFYLVLRGSHVTETGMKLKFDLDLDLILPREFAEVMKTDEKMKEVLDNLVTVNLKLTKLEEYADEKGAAKNIKNELRSKENFPQRPILSLNVPLQFLTRSLPLNLSVDGYNIDIDLFPKFIDEHGQITHLSSKNSHGTRNFIKESPLPPSGPKKKLNHEQKAAVIFLKLWKYKALKSFKTTVEYKYKKKELKDKIYESLDSEFQGYCVISTLPKLWKEYLKKSETVGEDEKSQLLELTSCIEYVKGYHFSLALDYILQHQPLDEHSEFHRDCVGIYISEILNYLIEAYSPESLNKPKFHFENIRIWNDKTSQFESLQPFLNDTSCLTLEKREELIKELKNLHVEFTRNFKLETWKNLPTKEFSKYCSNMQEYLRIANLVKRSLPQLLGPPENELQLENTYSVCAEFLRSMESRLCVLTFPWEYNLNLLEYRQIVNTICPLALIGKVVKIIFVCLELTNYEEVLEKTLKVHANSDINNAVTYCQAREFKKMSKHLQKVLDTLLSKRFAREIVTPLGSMETAKTVMNKISSKFIPFIGWGIFLPYLASAIWRVSEL